MVEGRANLEARFIVARLLAAPRRWQRRRGGGNAGGEPLEVGFDGGITGRQLALIPVKEFEVLLEHEDVLRAVIAGERGDDLHLGGVTPIVTMRREGLRIALPGDDVAEDAQAGDASDVAHDERQLDIWTNAFCIR